jgi:hypothetical protein
MGTLLRLYWHPVAPVKGSTTDNVSPFPDVIVHPSRSAPAVGFAQHRDDVAMTLARRIRQRVAPPHLITRDNVDMSAGGKMRQIFSGG